jgi:hypothetical protein
MSLFSCSSRALFAIRSSFTLCFFLNTYRRPMVIKKTTPKLIWVR